MARTIFYTKKVDCIFDTESDLWLTRTEEECIVPRLTTCRAGYDTSRKRWKVKTSAAEYLDILSGNVPESTATQLSYFGNGIGVHAGRS